MSFSDEQKIYSLLRDCNKEDGINSDILLETVRRAKDEGLLNDQKTAELKDSFDTPSKWKDIPQSEITRLSPSMQMEMKRKSLELKLHLVAASLGAGRDQGIEAIEADASHTLVDESSLVGAIWHRSGGVVSAQVGSLWVVLLPPLQKTTSEETINEIQKGCLELFESTNLEQGWVVDCSAVDELPLIIFGSLLGYRTTFKEWNATLSLCWLKDSAFPMIDTKSAKSFFDLHQVGDFWFSRKVKPEEEVT